MVATDKNRAGWMMVAGVALLAAGVACAAPGGSTATEAPTQAMTEAATQESMTMEAATPAPTEAATQSAAGGGKTIEAGSSKIATFKAYTVVEADGWTDNHQVAEGVVDTLLLAKGANTLMISQAAGGGGECHFDGTTGEGQVFPSGVGITGQAGQFMRGSADGGKNWTVCEKGPDTFGFPTDFGYITYKGSDVIDAVTLAEMDGMVASLTGK